MYNKIKELIEKYDRIIIHRHSNPDGDAIGSQVGLKHIIKTNYPEKEVYAVGDASKRYGFIEDCATDTIPDEYYNGALAFVLDTSAISLISDERYKTADAIVKMDHHIFTEKYADLELIDTSFESCCGLIGMFAMEAGLKLNASVTIQRVLRPSALHPSLWSRSSIQMISIQTFTRTSFISFS